MTGLDDRERDVEDRTLFGDEIDLRQVLQVFVNRWPWIILTTLAAGLVAAGYSFLVVSPTYEATALVAITPPKYVMQLSPGFEAVAEERIQTEIYGTYPELAESDELLQEVVAAVNEASGAGTLRLGRLRKSASVRGSKDVGLIYLLVDYSDRKLAATIVNIWAERYVSLLNRLYGGDAGDYEFFMEQLALAKDDLEATQDALAEFKARDLGVVLERQLAATDAALVERLSRRDEIDLLLQDIRGWQEQLVSQDPNDILSQGDELTAVLLQLKAFDVLMSESRLQATTEQESAEGKEGQTVVSGLTASAPVVQVAIGQLGDGRTVAEHLASLGDLGDWLEARSVELGTQIAELEPVILRLQSRYQEATNEGEQLTRQVEIASSLYESLALKAEESRIALESEAGVGRLASKAAVPANPVSPRKVYNTAVGAGLGLLAGVVLAGFLEIIGRKRKPAKRENPGDGE